MKRSIILLVSLLLPLLLPAADRHFITIETENTSLVLGTDVSGRLLQYHYGAKVGDASQYAEYDSYRRPYFGSDHQAYPVRGGQFFGDCALAVEYPDTDGNTELVYDGSRSFTAADGNVTTEITLRDRKTALEVVLVYEAYRDADVIVSFSRIRNGGRRTIKLERYASGAVTLNSGKDLLTHFHGDWAREMNVESELLTHGTKSIRCNRGIMTTHTESPSFLLSLGTDRLDENYGEVVAGTLAWSGNYRLDFQVDEFNKLNIISGINAETTGSYPLAGGAVFTTPEMVWTYSNEGAGQASRNLHDWARINTHSRGHLCPTLLNSWEGAYFDFNTKTLTDMIDDAASLGLEMFVLDDGWFGSDFPRNSDSQGLGDWETNLKKLPEGISYIADYAHSKGLKFGIWIEPEMVNPKSNLARLHPDWIVKSPGREATQSRKQWVLDLCNPKVQDFVFGVFDNTMKLGKIDYIKWDCNRDIHSYGSPAIEDQNRFYVDYIQGLYSVLDRVRAKYPDVMVQACSSGGARADYGSLNRFDEYWTSDNTEGLCRVFIQYGASMIFPGFVMGSHVSAVPNHQTGNVTPLKFRFDIASAGRLGMELQPARMTDEEKDYARRAIASYKGYRDLVEEGDLYRISSPYDSDIYSLMYVSKDKKRAVLFAYCLRYQGRQISPLLRLYGLDPSREYTIRELNSPKPHFWGEGGTFTGQWLREQGINTNLRKIYDSAVWYLESK